MTIREFRHEEEKEGQSSSHLARIARNRVGEEDEITSTLRNGLNAPVPQDVEMRMRASLRDFRVRLDRHPYVARLEGRGFWACFDLHEMCGRVLAGASIVLMVFGIYSMLPHLVVALSDAFGETAVAGVGVGRLKLGVPADQVEMIWGRPGEVTPGVLKYFDRGINVHLGAGGSVREISCHEAGSIRGPYKSYRGSTPEGVKIGTAEADVVAALGQPDQRVELSAGADGLVSDAVSLRYKEGLEVAVRSRAAKYEPLPAKVCTIKVMPGGTVLTRTLLTYALRTGGGEG